MLITSLIESIYIIYMFNYFKTEKYLSHPFDVFTKKIDFIDHSENMKMVIDYNDYTYSEPSDEGPFIPAPLG